MPRPTIDFTFSTLANTAIQRSQRGIVALILRDGTDASSTVIEYKSVAEIDSADWTASNLDLIQKTFLGSPSKVIVVRGSTTDTDYADQLAILANKKWNWLAIPGIADAQVAAVATQIKTWRDVNKKTFKAVLPNHEADNEAIINFSTEGIKVGETTYSASQYSGRIAGILAGLSLSRSATYFQLPEVESITESTDPDTDIDEGKLILINLDGEFVIGSGVTSLTTLTPSKGKPFTKIKIVEGMDLYKDDVTANWNKEFVGKRVNSYDEQVLFLTGVSTYNRGLGGTVLDSNYNNVVGIDVEAQRSAIEAEGIDTTSWTEQQIKEHTIENKVFLLGDLKFLDAMESLKFSVTLA